MNYINICPSPALFEYYATDNAIVVIVDAIRASATICTAFQNGISLVKPVAEIAEALELKKHGYLIAGERDGDKVDGFDFGNSPYEYQTPKIKGEKLAISTTNGTRAISIAKKYNPAHIVIGSFLNINKVIDFIKSQNKDVIVLCSGWKNAMNCEDFLFGGLLSKSLIATGNFKMKSDTVPMAISLLEASEGNYYDFVMKMSPRLHEKNKTHEADFRYCLETNKIDILPYLENDFLLTKN